MKILFVIDSLGSGGAQRQLVDIALELRSKHYEVDVLIYHESYFFKDFLCDAGVKVITIPEKNYLKRFIKIRKFLRKAEYSVVISFLDGSNFICELSTLPTKKWRLIANESNANPKIVKSVKLILFRYLHFLADAIVFNSKSNYKLVRKINPFLKESKCPIIYNAINYNNWKTAQGYHFLAQKDINLLVVASHHSRKNLDGLIEGVNLLSEKQQNQLKIIWYGDKVDNSYAKGLRKIKNLKLDRIFEFHAATSQIVDVMQRADAIGLFSLYEGLPNVLIEAMTLGKPVVASHVSDIPLLIDKELQCDPLDPQSIMRVLKTLIGLKKEELKRIGENNRLRAKDIFSKKNTMDAYINLILNRDKK